MTDEVMMEAVANELRLLGYDEDSVKAYIDDMKEEGFFDE